MREYKIDLSPWFIIWASFTWGAFSAAGRDAWHYAKVISTAILNGAGGF